MNFTRERPVVAGVIGSPVNDLEDRQMAEMTKIEARLLERHAWWKAAIADAETALKEDQWPRADTGY